jgi:hypothetical protein
MTSIITINRPEKIVIISDGRGKTAAGVAHTFSKCALIPGAPAIVAARGLGQVCHQLAADSATLSFDDLLKHGAAMMREYIKRVKGAPGVKALLGKEEITLAGFSTREDRLALYMMVLDDRYAVRGWKPYTFNEISDEITAAPQPSPENIEAAGFVCPEAVDFDPATHGLALMEAQRLAPGYADLIGNYIQASTVTRDGVSARIVYRWPDEIGKRIKPDAFNNT